MASVTPVSESRTPSAGDREAAVDTGIENPHPRLVPMHINSRFCNLLELTQPELAAHLFTGELYCEWVAPAAVEMLRIAFVCERDGEYPAGRELHLNVTGGLQSQRFRMSDMSDLRGVLTADNLNQVLIGGAHPTDLDIWVGLRIEAQGCSYDFFQATANRDAGTSPRSRRSLPFRDRREGRYWWFQTRMHDYVPALFAVLTDDEWDILDQWYCETDAGGAHGEANVPALSMLMGMVDGNSIPNIVQLGHHEGFSTLLLGFMMRRMGFKHSVFTVDINPEASRVCEDWVRRAGLAEFVSVNVASSDLPELPQMARDYFNSDISAVFIDSSHQYQHTLNELELWFPALKPFGFIFLHDVSVEASDFDTLQNGGVRQAISEWADRADASHILLNEDVVVGHNPPHLHQLVYHDTCGLGVIQKRHRWGASPD